MLGFIGLFGLLAFLMGYHGAGGILMILVASVAVASRRRLHDQVGEKSDRKMPGFFDPREM